MITNKQKLDALKADVEVRRRERDEAQARLDEAETARYMCEREINRTQKPTAAMLAAIKQMAEGAILRENRYNYGSYYLSTENGNPKIRNSVFYGLCSREAIEETEERRTWRITEHGRSLIHLST